MSSRDTHRQEDRLTVKLKFHSISLTGRQTEIPRQREGEKKKKENDGMKKKTNQKTNKQEKKTPVQQSTSDLEDLQAADRRGQSGQRLLAAAAHSDQQSVAAR